MRYATRISMLGTENAFSVAQRAQKHMEAGHHVYPFHLGDLNFKTPEHIQLAMQKALVDGKNGYCPAAGIMPLREALAHDINQARNTTYTSQNIIIQPGGKPVIGKFLMAFMNEGDEVLFPNPGFPIYESQIEFLLGKAIPYGFQESRDKTSYKIDIEVLEKSITPRTKLIIINDFHNPTGAECSTQDREKLAEIILKYDLIALVDEAYFDIRYEGTSHSILSIPEMKDRCVMLYTFSKKYAMTGWRIGALVSPDAYAETFARLNVNMESCTNHFVQYAALAALTGNPPTAMLKTLKVRRDTAVNMLNAIDGIACPSPTSTFYLFPNVTKFMEKKSFANNYAAFAEDVLIKTGVSFCTREHFGKIMPHEDQLYIRLAFSGINEENIIIALTALQKYAE